MKYNGQWLPGKHPPLVDRTTWDRVQVKLGVKTYKSHELTLAGELIHCAHCGGAVTGETVLKKQTGKSYVYYRCVNYKRVAGHPSVRLTETELTEQVVGLFHRIRQPDPIRDLFMDGLRDWTKNERAQSRRDTDDVQRQLTLLRQQQDQLLNLRLLQEIEADTFARKGTELRDRIATLSEQLKVADVDRERQAEQAAKVFELSQGLERQWVESQYAEKRQFLRLVSSNFRSTASLLLQK